MQLKFYYVTFKHHFQRSLRVAAIESVDRFSGENAVVLIWISFSMQLRFHPFRHTFCRHIQRSLWETVVESVEKHKVHFSFCS